MDNATTARERVGMRNRSICQDRKVGGDKHADIVGLPQPDARIGLRDVLADGGC
jgi:hypothetical protein